MPQEYNAELVKNLASNFPMRNEPNYAWGNALSGLLWFPRLKGLWAPGAIGVSNLGIDCSGNGLTVTPTASVPALGLNQLACYWDFTLASSQAYYRADEPITSITTNLSIFCWAQFHAPSTGVATHLVDKNGLAPQRGYDIYKDASNNFGFQVTVDGTAVTSVASSGVPYRTGAWYFLLGRYNPSNELALFVGRAKEGDWYKFTNTTSIPASQYDNTSEFNIGSYVNHTSGFFDGRLSLIGLGAAVPQDFYIWNIFQQTRPLYIYEAP